MPSLMELVDRVNKGDAIDAAQLEIYQESTNSAEKFLAHHAHAMLELRRAQQHILASLEAIDYSDQKVLNQFISISSFLGLTDLRAGPVVKFGAMAINRREYALGIEAIANGIVDPSFTSQLTVLSEDEYQRGVKRMREANDAAGGELQLVADFRLYATIGWL